VRAQDLGDGDVASSGSALRLDVPSHAIPGTPDADQTGAEVDVFPQEPLELSAAALGGPTASPVPEAHLPFMVATGVQALI